VLLPTAGSASQDCDAEVIFVETPMHELVRIGGVCIALLVIAKLAYDWA